MTLRAPSLSRLSRQWTLGAAALLVTALAALAFGVAAWLTLFLLALIFWPSITEAAFMDWLILSAVIWLPLAVGFALPILRQAERDSETDTGARRAPL